MKYFLAGLLCLMLTAVPAQAQFFMMGEPLSTGSSAVNPNSLILANTFNNDSHSTLSCFSNASDVGDFYGISGGEQGHQYKVAQAFFAGLPPLGAQFCSIRIGIGGTRSRILGATVCSGAAGGTPCDSETNTNALAALKGVTNGSLNITQNGVAIHVTGINLSTATSLGGVAPSVMSLVNSAISTWTNTNTVNATLAASSVAPGAPCTGVAGTVGNGFVDITAASGNCIYPGGNLSGVNGQGTIMAQYSGTPNGLGRYVISSNQALSTLVPQVFTAQTLTYNVLTVGTVSSGTIATGWRLSDTANLALSSVYARLSGGVTTQPASCTGSACNGSTWIIGSSGSQTVASEAMLTDLLTLGVSETAYPGVTVNTSRFWFEQTALCSSDAQNTITFVTSDSTASTDNLAYLLGFAANSPGVISTPVSGPLISLYSETVGDPADPLVPTYTAFLNNLYNNVAGASTTSVLGFWWDPDDGQQTPTFKNEISTWFNTHTTYTYARVWAGDYAYPVASYALNPTTGGMPPCVPAAQTFTATTSTWTPDYCPVHDYVLIGAAGNGAASTTGASGVPGGAGASGGASYLTGLTTASGIVAPTSFQVGTAGSGTNTAMHTWALTPGGDLAAGSGGNASGQTGGTLSATGHCTISADLYAGTFAACVNKTGATGQNGNATAGSGGSGGNSAGNAFVATTHIGFSGGLGNQGGGGGAGTSGIGTVGGTTSGGNSGTYLDGTTGGSGGTPNPNPGSAPGGGGAGTATATVTGGAGAAGHADTSLSTLTQPCGNNGPGGGGGGGGGNKAATGSGVGSGGAGGNGANYGGAGGTGGATTQTGGIAGTRGTGAGGFICIIGYQDH